MHGDLDPAEVERLLRRLPLSAAPRGLWDRIQATLASAEPVRPVPVARRPARPWLVAAATVAAVVTGTLAGSYVAYRAPSRWAVLPLAGAPRVGGVALTGGGELGAGEWLVTDPASRAELAVGRIGTVEVGPNTRVRIEKGGLLEHRLALESGLLKAAIAAPPRLFVVRTPSALATDLGCAYTLEVDTAGASRLHVTAGWVELAENAAVSLVPAGMVAEVARGGRPGTPYPEGFPADAQAALRRLDAGAGDDADLDVVFGALRQPTDFITLRQQSGITLWHIVQRVRPALRERVFDRLADLSPPPDGVAREGILALERPMLERWRRDLSPMWSEEAESWWVRLGRRLWEWTTD